MTKEQQLIKDFLEWQNTPFEIETDLPFLMKQTKGKMKPSHALGFWVYPDNQSIRHLVTGFYEAVDYVSSVGGKYC